jgi:MEMO1 family protein
LPLLQHAAPHAQVVPLFAGYLNPRDRDTAAETLAALCGPDTIFLVSSDLTHYGQAFGYQPFPADSKISARLGQVDRNLMEAAASLDAQFFEEAIEKSRANLCGRSPVALWLRALAFVAGDEIFQETLDYQTSGDVTGDYDHTVSYGALGYFPARSFWVDAAARGLLLESARETLRLLRSTGEHRPIPPREIAPALSRKPGVFVSLHQGERLLGCVGNRMGCESLAESVPETTLRAALDDPRFPTVLGVEGEVDIEISILSPMKPIRDARAFRLGVHGVTLDCSGRHALLLPQVAAGRDWSAEQFLSALSVKAGLGTRGYQNAGAHLSVFQAQVLAM